MKTNKIINRFVAVEIAIIPIFIAIIDSINGSNEIDKIDETKIILSTAVLSLIFFSSVIYFQYKIENRSKVLSCIYSPDTKCCLSYYMPLDTIYGTTHEVITDIELAEYELTVETDEIWLLSLDLSVECGDNIFKEVVRSRLKEGVQYNFISIKSPLAKERAIEIKRRYKSLFSSKKIHFYLLENNEYYLFLSLYSVAIYNPTNSDDGTQAYVCIGESNGSETSIYAKLNKTHTKIATNITREIIENTVEFYP